MIFIFYENDRHVIAKYNFQQKKMLTDSNNFISTHIITKLQIYTKLVNKVQTVLNTNHKSAVTSL